MTHGILVYHVQELEISKLLKSQLSPNRPVVLMQSKSQQALLEKENKDKFTLKCTQRGKEF